MDSMNNYQGETSASNEGGKLSTILKLAEDIRQWELSQLKKTINILNNLLAQEPEKEPKDEETKPHNAGLLNRIIDVLKEILETQAKTGQNIEDIFKAAK